MDGRVPKVRVLSVTNLAMSVLAVGVIIVVGPGELVDRAVRVRGWQGSMMAASTYMTFAVVLLAAGLSATLSTRPRPLLVVGGSYFSALALARILSVGWRSEAWLSWVAGVLFIGMNLAALFFVQRFQRTLVPETTRAGSSSRLARLLKRFADALLELKGLILWVVVFGGVAEVFQRLSGNSLPMQMLVASWALAAFLYLRRGFLTAEGLHRRRLFWLFETLLVVVIADLAVVAIGLVPGSLIRPYPRFVLSLFTRNLGDMAHLVCLVIAIFWAGSVDPSLVVKRTFVVSTLVAIASAVFLGVEVAITESLIEVLGYSEGVAAVAAGTTAALAFRPVHTTVERSMKRWAGSTVPTGS